jgi:hypothetical protein
LSDRLKRKARYSVSAITLVSFYVFAISLFTLVFETSIPVFYPRVLSTLSIVLSVFIIIITLLEDSKKYALDADHSWEIARALENLNNRYEITVATAGGKEEEIQRQYAEILHSARTSRRALDYHLFQLSNAEAFELKGRRYFGLIPIFLLESAVEYWLYGSMIIAPLIAMGWIVYKILPIT